MSSEATVQEQMPPPPLIIPNLHHHHNPVHHLRLANYSLDGVSDISTPSLTPCTPLLNEEELRIHCKCSFGQEIRRFQLHRLLPIPPSPSPSEIGKLLHSGSFIETMYETLLKKLTDSLLISAEDLIERKYSVLYEDNMTGEICRIECESDMQAALRSYMEKVRQQINEYQTFGCKAPEVLLRLFVIVADEESEFQKKLKKSILNKSFEHKNREAAREETQTLCNMIREVNHENNVRKQRIMHKHGAL